MAQDPTTPDLTTHDVFLQIDRRLTLIEEDLRTHDVKLNTQIADLRHETQSGLADLRNETQSGLAALHHEMNARFSRVDTKFQWVVGILLASWVSTMGTLLLK